MYEGHFRSNITVPVTLWSMIQFSKTIPHFIQLYITYKMVTSKTKNACWAWSYSFIYTVGINTLNEKWTKYHVSSTNILEQKAWISANILLLPWSYLKISINYYISWELTFLLDKCTVWSKHTHIMNEVTSCRMIKPVSPSNLGLSEGIALDSICTSNVRYMSIHSSLIFIWFINTLVCVIHFIPWPPEIWPNI